MCGLKPEYCFAAIVCSACFLGEMSHAQTRQSNMRHCVQQPCVPEVYPAPGEPVTAAPGRPQEEPQADQPMYAAPAPPAMYVAPSPSGERVGETRSFGLPEITFTLPSLSFSTPGIRIQGFRRGVRDSHMRLDSAYAPQTAGQPAVYGQLMGATVGQVHAAAPMSASAGGPRDPDSAGAATRQDRDEEPASPATAPPRAPGYYRDPCSHVEGAASELYSAQQELQQLRLQLELLQRQIESRQQELNSQANQSSQPPAPQHIQQAAAHSFHTGPQQPAPHPMMLQEQARQLPPETQRILEAQKQREAAEAAFESYEQKNPAPKGWKRMLPTGLFP